MYPLFVLGEAGRPEADHGDTRTAPSAHLAVLLAALHAGEPNIFFSNYVIVPHIIEWSADGAIKCYQTLRFEDVHMYYVILLLQIYTLCNKASAKYLSHLHNGT